MLVFHASLALHHDDLAFLRSRQLLGFVLLFGYTLLLFADPTASSLPGFDML